MSTIKCVAKLERILFPKGVYETQGGFTIATFKPVEIIEGKIELDDYYGTFSVKGDMPSVKEGSEYHITMTEGERHHQFGLQYVLTFMRQEVDLDTSDKKSVKNFLRIILTERQATNLCEAFDDPIAVIESRDIEKLCTVQGVGEATANRIIKHYDSQRDYSYAYMELGQFDISPSTIKKVTDFYGSPELAVEKVKANPFQLMEIDGYGFKTCDRIFLSMGGDPNAKIRIKSFLTHHLLKEAEEGHTYTSPLSLMRATVQFIPNADKTLIGKIISQDTKEFYLSDDKSRISLQLFRNMEQTLSDQISRVLNAKSNFDFSGWEKIVEELEKEQGWEFTKSQLEAIEMILNENVSMLSGVAGSGKSTIMKAVTRILDKKHYTYIQTALSGKASNNLAEVTGRDGYTIHRALKYSPMIGGFYYNSKNKMPHHVLIVDEISMVDAQLSMFLTMAIRSGAKIIFLGDHEQLKPIGIPVMAPIMESESVPITTLTEIHRQAQKSGVIVDSLKIRNGEMPLSPRETNGRFIHGELQDLEYELVKNDEDIFVETIKEFHKHIQSNSIDDIQILSQQRATCLRINNACQKVYNPPSDLSKEVLISKQKKKGNAQKEEYYLRVGDKVMNNRNNYSAKDDNGNESPVFNGNTGILKDISKDEQGNEYLLIDFDGIGRVRIYKAQYKTIELAYCITVHKAQGSSSKIVIIAFPAQFVMNSRQILYTAMTRTSERCIVIARKRSISGAIRKDDVSNKRTYLAEFLRKGIGVDTGDEEKASVV